MQLKSLTKNVLIALKFIAKKIFSTGFIISIGLYIYCAISSHDKYEKEDILNS